MNLNFKIWLEGVGDILRVKVPMDEHDIAYLEKFPPEARMSAAGNWITKIKERYNEHLDAALDENGEMKPDYVDEHNIKAAIEKLKNLGLDVRNTNPGSGHLAGMKLMTWNQARDLMVGVKTYGAIGWLKWSNWPEERLKPGYAYWKPNHNFRSRQIGNLEFNVKDLVAEIESVIDELLARTPNTIMANEKNYLTGIAFDWLKNNTGHPEFSDSHWRKLQIKHVVRSELQKDFGVGTRRNRERAKKMGLPHDEFNRLVYKRDRGRPKNSIIQPGEPIHDFKTFLNKKLG